MPKTYTRKPPRRLTDTIIDNLIRKYRTAYQRTPPVLLPQHEESDLEARGLRILIMSNGHATWGYRDRVKGIPWRTLGEYPVMLTDDARPAALTIRRGEAIAPAVAAPRLPSASYTDVVKAFMAHQLKRAENDKTASNSADTYNRTINGIGLHFGKRPYLEVSPSDTTAYVLELAKERTTRVPITVLKLLAKFAEEKQLAPEGWGARMAAEFNKQTFKDELPKVPVSKVKRVERRALDPLELSVLWAASDPAKLPADMHDYGVAFRLMMLNPFRIDEIISLRRSEIQTYTVPITRTVQRGLHIGGNTKLPVPANGPQAKKIEINKLNRRTKTTDPVWLPLAPASLALIDAHPAYEDDPVLLGLDSWVFDANGKSLKRFRKFAQAEWEAREQPGKMKPWDHHCLRHTFSSHARGLAAKYKGAALFNEVVEALQGHAVESQKGTAKTYNAYDFAEEKAVVLVLWEDFVFLCRDGAEIIDFAGRGAA